VTVFVTMVARVVDRHLFFMPFRIQIRIRHSIVMPILDPTLKLG